MRLVLFLVTISSWAWASSCLGNTPPVTAYSVEPGIQAAAISPNGETLALAIADQSTQFIKLIGLNDLKPTSTVIIDFKFRRNTRQDILWIGWATNDTLLANVQSIDGGIKNRVLRNSRLVSASRDGKTLEDLGYLTGVALGGTAERFNGSGIISLLPDDPEHILMNVGSAATKLNIHTGHATLVRRGSSKTSSLIPDLRGEVRVGFAERPVGGSRKISYLSIRDTNGKKWRDYENYPGLKADEKIVGFTENPDELIIARYGNADTLEFQIYDLERKTITRTLFSDPKYDAQSLVYNGGLDKVIGVNYVAETPQTRFLESENATDFNALKGIFPLSNITVLADDGQQEKFLVRLSSPTNSGEIYLVNSSTKKKNLLAYDYPELHGIEGGPVTVIEYPANDGQTISGYLTLPANTGEASKAKNLPFIVMPHGGPYSRDYARFDWLSQYLSAQGYGVLQMNFRGSDGFGEAFLEKGRNDWSIMRSDVYDGTKWLIDEGFANPEKICILGWSFGGYLAQMAASQSDANYACAASINGISDWYGMNLRDDDEFWGSVENYKRQIKNSPRSNVETVEIPIYLGHGELDTIVPYEQSKRYARALKKSKKDHVFVSFPGADHGIEDQENRTELLNSLTEFLETHLGENNAR